MAAKIMFRSEGFRYIPYGETEKINGVMYRKWIEHPEKDVEDLDQRKYRNIPTDFKRKELIAVFNDYPCNLVREWRRKK